MPLRFDHIKSRIRDHKPARMDPKAFRRKAAVAAVLVPDGASARLLLIRRAEHPNDPWSGHMALPGGRFEPTDADLLATAVRESREELSLDLQNADLLGSLDDVEAVARGRRVGMMIRPYVFAVDRMPELQPNYEVAEYLWPRIDPIFFGESDTEFPWQYQGALWKLPAWRVEGHTVWGLTHRMLSGFFELLR